MEANQVAEQARQTGQQVKESAQQVKESAQQWGQKAKGTARDAGAAADLYLHEYAWTTVALVALGAAFFGFILGRRQAP